MEDLFFSYTHSDRERVRPIVNLLEDAGWTLWWDRDIEPGVEWHMELDEKLAKCGAVVVIWSKTSVKSEWVKHEAEVAHKERKLVPIMIDANQCPHEYSHIQATDLSAWKGKSDVSEVEALIRGLAKIVPPSQRDKVRPGYDPYFLGENYKIKLPDVPTYATILRYMHFTVVMNPFRRLAYYVAYNTDNTQLVDLPREDSWVTDPLIPKS